MKEYSRGFVTRQMTRDWGKVETTDGNFWSHINFTDRFSPSSPDTRIECVFGSYGYKSCWCPVEVWDALQGKQRPSVDDPIDFYAIANIFTDKETALKIAGAMSAAIHQLKESNESGGIALGVAKILEVD